MKQNNYEEKVNEIITDVRNLFQIFEKATKMELMNAENSLEDIREKIAGFLTPTNNSQPK